MFLCWVEGRDEVDIERKWGEGWIFELGQPCPSKRLERVVKKGFSRLREQPALMWHSCG